MATVWTPAWRERQSGRLRNWRPWEKSTRSKSPEGKAKVSRNAYKGGWREQLRELRRILGKQVDSLRTI